MTSALFPEEVMRSAAILKPADMRSDRYRTDHTFTGHAPKKQRRQAPEPNLGPRRPWEYRSKVARALGRPLKTHEIVHHINGDYTDNRLDNLMLLSSQAAHMFLHALSRRRAQGLRSMFAWEELLRFHREHVIWVTAVGYATVNRHYG